MPVEAVRIQQTKPVPAATATRPAQRTSELPTARTTGLLRQDRTADLLHRDLVRRIVTADPAPRATSGIHLDRTYWEVTVDGRVLTLTYLEFEVLDFLVSSPGRVYSRAALIREVWSSQGEGGPVPGERSVDVLITRLRQKLGQGRRHEIETVRRVGYRYRPTESVAS